MRRLVLFVLLAVACSACAGARPLRTEDPLLGTVLSVTPVHVEEGFELWQQGERRTFKDGLLIHVSGDPASAYVATAVPAPWLMLGDTVVIQYPGSFSPASDDAVVMKYSGSVLLAASLPPDTVVPLWWTPRGQVVKQLKGEHLARMRAWATRPERADGLDVRTPPAGTPRKSYQTLNYR